MMDLLRFIAALLLAVGTGKLFQRLRLPYVLGWLLIGMLLGPYALALVPPGLKQAEWYGIMASVVKFGVGAVMGLGTGGQKDKKSGRQFLTIAATESLFTFALISAVFFIALRLNGMEPFFATLYGSIGMITSAATAVAVLKSFQAKGPLASALMPVLSRNNLISLLVFLLALSLSVSSSSAESASILSVLLSLGASVGGGLAMGILASLPVNKASTAKKAGLLFFGLLLVLGLLVVVLNKWVLHGFGINYLIAGICLASALAARVNPERLTYLKEDTKTISDLIFAYFIVTLGLDINYRLVLAAGIYMVVFVAARIAGKLAGAYMGGKLAKADPLITRNIGALLLPHASTCLILTAVTTDTLSGVFPAQTELLQGTLMASIIINEIAATFIIKKSLKRAGELPA